MKAILTDTYVSPYFNYCFVAERVAKKMSVNRFGAWGKFYFKLEKPYVFGDLIDYLAVAVSADVNCPVVVFIKNK